MRAANNNFIVHEGNQTLQIFNEASFLYGEFISAEMERIGMRYSYRYVLNPLMENESLTQLELVRITGQKPPTISITLRNMEREGIVEREKNGGDRRETHVSITEKGKKMYAKVLASLEKAEKAVLKGISEKELNAMGSTVEKMKKNIETALK